MIAKLKQRVASLPGKTTRQELAKAARPPMLAFLRCGMRLIVAALLYLGGFETFAKIVAVLAFMPVVGAVEVQTAKVLEVLFGKVRRWK